MAGSILLALVAVELALGAVVAIAYVRRTRRLRAIGSIHRVQRLVGQAADLGHLAQNPDLSIADRSALLEETRAALEHAMTVLRSEQRPIELPAPPASRNGTHRVADVSGSSDQAATKAGSPGREERPAA
jgi:hypothetical protein